MMHPSGWKTTALTGAVIRGGGVRQPLGWNGRRRVQKKRNSGTGVVDESDYSAASRGLRRSQGPAGSTVEPHPMDAQRLDAIVFECSNSERGVFYKRIIAALPILPLNFWQTLPPPSLCARSDLLLYFPCPLPPWNQSLSLSPKTNDSLMGLAVLGRFTCQWIFYNPRISHVDLHLKRGFEKGQ